MPLKVSGMISATQIVYSSTYLSLVKVNSPVYIARKISGVTMYREMYKKELSKNCMTNEYMPRPGGSDRTSLNSNVRLMSGID